MVPRTFCGAFMVYVASLPAYTIMKLILGNSNSGFVSQLICRLGTGMLSWLSFIHFRNGVSNKFGRRVGELTTILISCQFHICFYMSRMLPNTFALMFVLHAYGFWFKGSPVSCILTIAFAMVIFRCDLLVLLVPLTLQLLISREISFWRSLVSGVLVCILALMVTVTIDSLMWKQR